MIMHYKPRIIFNHSVPIRSRAKKKKLFKHCGKGYLNHVIKIQVAKTA